MSPEEEDAPEARMARGATAHLGILGTPRLGTAVGSRGGWARGPPLEAGRVGPLFRDES